MGYALYVDTILHDDRGSNHALATKSADGRCRWEQKLLAADGIRGRRPFLWVEQDWYLSVNGFVGRGRDSGQLRQKNALVFDLDAHGGDHDRAVPLAIAALDAAVSRGLVPEPTMVVSTGRGLQLYYVLERSIPAKVLAEDGSSTANERALGFASDVESRLDAALAAYVCAHVPGIDVDPCVHDAARVMRVPGTVNVKAGARCRLVAHSGSFHTLARLKAATKPPENLPARRKASRSARALAIEKPLPPLADDAFLRARMRSLEALVELREAGRGSGPCAGRCRNEALFAYYNAAAQLLGRDAARERTALLNATFSEPLGLAEVKGIFRSCEKAGCYRLTNAWVLQHLGVTDAEAAEAGLLWSRRAAKRAEARERTAARRAGRNAEIVRLRDEGRTQAEIARAVGCSRRTVCSVLDEKGLTKRRRKAEAQSPASPARPLRAVRRLCNFWAGEQGVGFQGSREIFGKSRPALPAPRTIRKGTAPCILRSRRRPSPRPPHRMGFSKSLGMSKAMCRGPPRPRTHPPCLANHPSKIRRHR